MKKRLINKIKRIVKRNSLTILIAICLMLTIVLLDSLGIIDASSITKYNKSNEPIDAMSYNTLTDEYIVTRVVDGDTFVINYEGNQRKVRLIGVDTAESVHPDLSKNTEFGKIVSNYSKNVLENEIVKLEFDVQKEDKYGRLLAYVYTDNGEMYNEHLLKIGYAVLATYPPNVKHVENFKLIQTKAREEKVGVWSE